MHHSVYLANSEPGFNQSHYYQHTKSDKNRILLNPQDKAWKFDSLSHNIFAKNGVFLAAATSEGDLTDKCRMATRISGVPVLGFSLIFNLFDPLRMKPLLNLTGKYGSAGACLPSRRWNFEYSYMNSTSRKAIMDFMDSIPERILRNSQEYFKL
jgi:hypothetical protein